MQSLACFWRPIGAVLAVVALSIGQVAAFQPPARPPLPNFDKRKTTVRAPSESNEQTKAVAELRGRVPKIKVDFNPVTGSPQFISSTDGLLSGPDGEGKAISVAGAAGVPPNDSDRATKAFLTEHSKVFGHGPEVLGGARVKREFTTPHNGVRSMVWQQQVDGIPVFEAMLISHTTRRGELVNLSSQLVPNPDAAANRGTPARARVIAAPTISATEAVMIAARHLGEDTQQVTAGAVDGGAEKRQTFRATFLRGECRASLVWLPMNRETLRLCWEITLNVRQRAETYRVIVDAQTGEVIIRRSLTAYLTNATFRVFTSDSPSPFSPGHPTPLTNQPPLIARTLVTLPALNTNASPKGWIDDAVNETRGNNVDAHTDRTDDDLPDLPRPSGSPFRVFDFPMDLASQDALAYSNASVAQLFYTCNWMHDKLYELGFTEAAGNFQTTNFGRGGIGNDALLADALDGGGTDNANMTTDWDGFAPRMQMYVFSGPTPRRDGSMDIEIVLHEYTHGLSSRRVGGGVGIFALQSEGMGEGWSDWYGLTLLSESGDDVNGVYAAGAYATFRFSPSYLQNYYFGIRRYPYSTDLTKNPLTFKDIDPGQASAHAGVPRSPIVGNQADEVHNQGEVWCVTLWEARANLIAKHGFEIGNRLILQLVTDGMNFSPADPNFLQARDAILQADIVNNAGANQRELWAAFAKRGMGANATSPGSSTTVGVVENFEVPDFLQVTPRAGFNANGPVGGPFTPDTVTFTLTNIGTSNLTWVAASTSAWLNISMTNGALATGGPAATVTVSLNSVANTLPQGIYMTTVSFTNLTSGVGIGRKFSVRAVSGPFFDDFEPDIDLVQWDAFSPTVLATNYGGSVSPPNSLWFGGDDFSRFAESRPINTSTGGVVDFYLRISDGGTEPWEEADLPEEGIVLEYSIDGGATWVELERYITEIYKTWTHIVTDLPPEAQTPATKFRWMQLEHSGACCDHWALDDVSVITGPRPPSIVRQPPNRLAVIGGSAEIPVTARGSAPLSYQWRKDGTNVVGATNSSYALVNVQSNHAGLYNVVITNLYGAITSAVATLTVLPASAVVAVFDDPAYVDSDNTEDSESDNVQATVQNIGLPTISFTNLLTASNYLRIIIPEQEVSPLAPDLTPAAQASLSNFVFNGGKLIVHGEFRGAAASLLNTVFHFSIVELLNNGASLNRGFEAGGTEFSDDPASISNNDATTVFLRSTLPAGSLNAYTNASGSGVVLIEYGRGSIAFLGWDWWDADPVGSQDGGWLNVLESALIQGPLPPRPPTIASQPADRATVTNRTARFAVGAIGSQPLSFQWRKGGANIGGATNALHIIFNVQTNHAGPYDVVVTNLYGSITSSIATLTVRTNGGCPFESNLVTSIAFIDALAIPTVMPIAFDGSNYWASAGGDTDGDRLARYDLAGNLISKYAPGLDFRSVFNDESGHVFARTFGERTIYRQTSPGVFQPSGITLAGGLLDEQSSVVLDGFGTEFIAMADGTVSRWALDGTSLGSVSLIDYGSVPGESDYPANRGIAAAGDVWLTYNGTGILSAWDENGERLAQINLIDAGSDSDSAFSFSYCDGKVFVVDSPGGLWRGYDFCAGPRPPRPPLIAIQPASHFGVIGSATSFNVLAVGTLPLHYQWRKDGTNLVAATNATYSIANVQSNHAGGYTVIVTNLYGSATSSVATLTALPASAVVAVFDNPAYVDSDNTEDSESDNVQASIQSLGFPVLPFTNLLAAGTYRRIVIPEQEVQPLAPNLTAAARASLSNFVFGGGKLIVHGNISGHAGTLLNTVFGFAIDERTSGGASSGQSIEAAGTEFASDSTTLLDNDATSVFVRSSLPPGSLSIYTNDVGATVVLIEYGSGFIVFLGWDWYDAKPVGSQNGGWLAALESALIQGPLPPRPPIISLPPVSRSVVAGAPVNFSVTAVGSLPLRYQWRRDGTNVIDATNSTYSITSVQSNFVGGYSVVVTNSYGAVTSSVATLTIVPPNAVVGVFDDPLYIDSGGGTSAESDNLQATVMSFGLAVAPFTDAVTGVGSYRRIIIPEQENRALGPDLPPGSRSAISNFVFGGGNLIVHGNGAASSASGLLNAVFRFSLQETSNPGGFFSRTPDANGTEFVDDPLTISHNNATTVLLPSSLPPGSLKIYTNAAGSAVVLIPHGSGFIVFMGWDWFDAAPAGHQNAGWLTVLESALLQGSVCAGCPPRFVLQPANQFVLPGTNVTLVAQAAGSAGPIRYQWRFEGTNLAGATNSTYSFTNASLDHHGFYSVTATDINGTATSSNAFLYVLVRPEFVTPPQSQTVLQGGTAIFSVVVTGAPPIYFRWIRGGVGYQTSSVPLLVLTNCQSNTTIRVALTNLATGPGGINSSVVQLIVLSDLDQDGMADVWEAQYGFNPNNAADALLDLDGDGMINRDEYVAGTDPTNPLSLLKLTVTTTNSAVLEFVAQSNVTYTLQYRTNLSFAVWSNFMNIDAQPQARTVQVRALDPLSFTSPQFYRIVTPIIP